MIYVDGLCPRCGRESLVRLNRGAARGRSWLRSAPKAGSERLMTLVPVVVALENMRGPYVVGSAREQASRCSLY